MEWSDDVKVCGAWGSTSGNQWFDEICLYVQVLLKRAKDPRCIATLWPGFDLWSGFDCGGNPTVGNNSDVWPLAVGFKIYPTWWPKPDITALRTCSEVIRNASFMSFELCNVALVDPSRSVRKEEGGGNSAKVEGSRHCRRAAQAGGGTATMLGRWSWGTARRCARYRGNMYAITSQWNETYQWSSFFKDNLNIISWNSLLYIYLCPGYSKREFDAIVFLVCVCVVNPLLRTRGVVCTCCFGAKHMTNGRSKKMVFEHFSELGEGVNTLW